MPRRPEKSEWQRGFERGYLARVAEQATRLSNPAVLETQHRMKPKDTELDAARFAFPRSGTQRLAVLQAVSRAGEAGLTDSEIAEQTGLWAYSVVPRRGELMRGGWVCDAGFTRESPRGGMQIAWVLTDEARVRLAAPAYPDGRERRSPGPAATAQPLRARRTPRVLDGPPLRPTTRRPRP